MGGTEFGVVVTGLLMIAVTAAQFTTTNTAPAPDRYCLACLCTAATGCNLSTGCVMDAGRPICGPFYISQPYWIDADVTAQPEFASLGFQECAKDENCAAATVKAYMTKFGRDCDGDGQITCSDYGLMHWLGYSSCSHPALRASALRTAFLRGFNQCFNNVERLLEQGREPVVDAACSEEDDGNTL